MSQRWYKAYRGRFTSAIQVEKDDVLDVAMEGLDRMIPKPREIYVEDGGVGLVSVAIVDAEETRQIVKLRDPMALPAPRAEV